MASTTLDLLREIYGHEHPSLGPPEIAVLVALAWHANGDGVCWPGNALLALETGWKATAVKDALARLERHKYISREAPHRFDRIITLLPPGKWEGALPRMSRPPHGQGVAATRPGGSRHTAKGGQGATTGGRDPAEGWPPHGTEPVLELVSEPVNELVSEPGQHSVLHRDGEEMKPEPKPVASSTGLLEYFMSRMRAALRDYELPIPGGFNKRAVLGRIGQIRKSSGIDWPEFVELVDLYMKTPTLWNPKVHPAADFVTGNTFARLRNRNHEIRVTSQPEPAATAPRSAMQERNRAHIMKYAVPDDEGSD